MSKTTMTKEQKEAIDAWGRAMKILPLAFDGMAKAFRDAVESMKDFENVAMAFKEQK